MPGNSVISADVASSHKRASNVTKHGKKKKGEENGESESKEKWHKALAKL